MIETRISTTNIPFSVIEIPVSEADFAL
jgi:hypothetical protein